MTECMVSLTVYLPPICHMENFSRMRDGPIDLQFGNSAWEICSRQTNPASTILLAHSWPMSSPYTSGFDNLQ